MSKIPNEYDQIKGFLNKIRKIQATTEASKYGMIKEQIDDNQEKEYSEPSNSEKGYEVQDPTIKNVPGEEQEDIAVINDVEVVIHSEDPEDLELKDDEKTKISQLVDDFRSEVSEIAEFDKLHVYNDSVRLDGNIPNINLTFSLSTGSDTGLYISNPSMLKIDDDSLNIINKLRQFEPKFINSINDLLVNRSTT